MLSLPSASSGVMATLVPVGVSTASPSVIVEVANLVFEPATVA